MESWNEGNSSFTIMSSASDNHQFEKLRCIISLDPGSVSNQTLVITSQDCLQFSETNTLTNYEDDVNFHPSNADGTYVDGDGIELYKTGIKSQSSLKL